MLEATIRTSTGKLTKEKASTSSIGLFSRTRELSNEHGTVADDIQTRDGFYKTDI